MMRFGGLRSAAICLVVLPFGAWTATGQQEEKGIELGLFRITPRLYLLGAYDDRVAVSGSDALEDFYGETAASLNVENTEALYDVDGWASYGYRAYDQHTVFNDDFHDVGGSVASRETALETTFSAYRKKTLDYDVGAGGRQELGARLTPQTSTRSSARLGVGYPRQLTDRSSVTPSYDGWYYNQDVDGSPGAEWQEHGVNLKWGYAYSQQTQWTLSGGYQVQIGDIEDGAIGTVGVGTESRFTDKIEWNAFIGFSVADYEQSGTDQGIDSSLRAQWQATDKVSVYAFGGNNYQQGYDGSGALKVYRLGYGADWAMTDRAGLNLDVLHDYQDGIQGNTGPLSKELGEVRHFVTCQFGYGLTPNVSLSLRERYINDEEETDQLVSSLQVVLSY